MNNIDQFKQKLSKIMRRWREQDYRKALAEVEEALKLWPGNARLHVLWASLIQLQENTDHDLDEVKRALRHAMDLDAASPEAAIELGHFLDCVEDDPRAASKAYKEGVSVARRILIDGLIGLAKALQQLEEREECLRCLIQILHLVEFETASENVKRKAGAPDNLYELLIEQLASRVNGPYAEQIQELLSDVVSKRSA